MKQMLKYLLIIFALIIANTGYLYSQHLPLNNQYISNPYSLSPAFAGYNNKSQMFFGYRHQWTSIPGSPKTGFLNICFPVSHKTWLGSSIISDQNGIFNYFYGSLSYTYKLRVGEYNNFRFSAWGTYYQNTINLSDLNIPDTDDPLLKGKTRLTGTAFNAGFGFVFQTERLLTGFSIPNILENNKTYALESTKNLVPIKRQFLAYGSYYIYLSRRYAIKPGFVIRSNHNMPVYYDIYALLEFEKHLWAGLIYRKGPVVAATIGGILINNITFNYTFEFAGSVYSAFTSGTHEVSIGFNVNIGKKYQGKKFEYYPQNLEYNPKYKYN